MLYRQEEAIHQSRPAKTVQGLWWMTPARRATKVKAPQSMPLLVPRLSAVSASVTPTRSATLACKRQAQLLLVVRSDDEDPASIWLRRLSEKRQQEKIDASCACSQQDQAYFDATVHEGARNGDPSGTVGRCAGPRDDDGYDEEQSS